MKTKAKIIREIFILIQDTMPVSTCVTVAFENKMNPITLTSPEMYISDDYLVLNLKKTVNRAKMRVFIPYNKIHSVSIDDK